MTAVGDTIRAELPAEEPIGSVVLDFGGLAWQHVDAGQSGRGRDAWYPAAWTGGEDAGTTWAQMLTLGPLTVIHVPPGS